MNRHAPGLAALGLMVIFLMILATAAHAEEITELPECGPDVTTMCHRDGVVDMPMIVDDLCIYNSELTADDPQCEEWMCEGFSGYAPTDPPECRLDGWEDEQAKTTPPITELPHTGASALQLSITALSSTVVGLVLVLQTKENRR